MVLPCIVAVQKEKKPPNYTPQKCPPTFILTSSKARMAAHAKQKREEIWQESALTQNPDEENEERVDFESRFQTTFSLSFNEDKRLQ